MQRPLLAAAALVMLGACTVSTSQPAPAEPASQVSLHPNDLPADLHRCPASGDVDSYLKSLKTGGGLAVRDLTSAWQQARAAGATAGWVSAYAADNSACLQGFPAPGGRSAASLSIRYKDRSRADAAWHRGILDFPQPASDQQAPGLAQGIATGLGRNSWTYQRTGADGVTTYIAFWQNGSFDVLLATRRLSESESQLAAAAVDGRVR